MKEILDNVYGSKKALVSLVCSIYIHTENAYCRLSGSAFPQVDHQLMPLLRSVSVVYTVQHAYGNGGKFKVEFNPYIS